jgi:hypothetical protein
MTCRAALAGFDPGEAELRIKGKAAAVKVTLNDVAAAVAAALNPVDRQYSKPSQANVKIARRQSQPERRRVLPCLPLYRPVTAPALAVASCGRSQRERT